MGRRPPAVEGRIKDKNGIQYSKLAAAVNKQQRPGRGLRRGGKTSKRTNTLTKPQYVYHLAFEHKPQFLVTS